MVGAVQKGLDVAYRPEGKKIQYITSNVPAVGGALLDAYHLAQINVLDNIPTVLQSELNRYKT